MKKICGAIALSAAMLLPTFASADTIDPATYSATLAVGESVTIRKTVTIDEVAPTGGIIDVMFLIDTSGSMGGEIDLAKAAAADILSGLSSFGDVATGVGYYSEPGSDGVYHDLTTSAAEGIADINTIDVGLGGYGGDFPEEGLHATRMAAEGASWRPGSTRFIIALGDANFKESDGTTLAATQAALAASGATFIGIDYGSGSYSMAGTGSGGISATTLSGPSGGSIISASGMSVAALVDDITSGVTASFAEYSTVDVSDVAAGLPGVGVSVTCVSADVGSCVGATATGDFDRSVVRTFEFDVTFTGLEEGLHEFDTLALVDGGAVATEFDSITVSEVPVPATLALMGLGLLGLAGVRRRRS